MTPHPLLAGFLLPAPVPGAMKITVEGCMHGELDTSTIRYEISRRPRAS